MTSLKDIQSLIADIDSILTKADARLPWSKAGDVAKARLVLERVRSYLVSQQQNFVAAAKEPPVPVTPAQKEVVQHIVQAVTQEMIVWRANLMQPLQADVEALRQQREALVQEIRQLEQKRQQIDSTNQRITQERQLISEFSQGLINRCTETLVQQLAQILANFERRVINAESSNRSLDTALAPHSALTLGENSSASASAFPHPQETQEQLRKLQENSDQLLTTLEANQRTIFEALGRDLQAYQASLSQGLEKMHSLGSQGEMLFTALVNRLLEQLGRQASTILSTSAQLSDSASPTTPETLLPTDALSVAGPLPQPNPTFNLQPPLQKRQTLEPLSLQPETVNTDAINPNSTDEQETILKADSLPSLLDFPESSPADYSQENLTSEDWEIVEGLDSENLDFDLGENDKIETFIQLDIDEQASLSSRELDITPNSIDSQESDFLLNWLNERQQSASTSLSEQATGLGNAEVAAELTRSADRRRQEIDELYQSLFGTDSSIDTANLDQSDLVVEGDPETLEPIPASEDNQVIAPQEQHEAIAQSPEPNLIADDQNTNTDSVIALPPQVENVLFEGLSVSAAAAQEHQTALDPQAQPPVEATEELPHSWEALLFEDAVPHSPSQTDLAQAAQPLPSTGDSLLNRNSNSEQEGIETIARLTDLFETMGVSPSPSATEGNSIPVSNRHSDDPTSSPKVRVVEDKYIWASPEEDLLETDTLESDPDVDISLNPNTLQQLQQDLYSFENPLDQNAQTQDEQWLTSHDVEGSTLIPETDQRDEQNQQYLFPHQESLAEDWEEFVLNHWLKQQEFADDSIPLAAEAVESDFDPDLFPSEALELGESTLNASTAASQELSLPPEVIGKQDAIAYIAFEDENVVDQMQWDEPTDSNTEEALAQWDAKASFASGELELDSDFFTQEALDTDLEGEGSTAIPVAIREEVYNDSSDRTQGTVLPQDSVEHGSDILPVARVNLEPQESESVEHSTPDNQVVTPQEQVQPSTQGQSEDAPSQNPTQETQSSGESNFDVNCPQTQVLNSEEPDVQP